MLNLTHEYSIITGKRKLTRASLLYMGCRWCTLVFVILEFMELNGTRGLNCQAFITADFTFACLSFLFASALVILRIYALWERKKAVFIITTAIWCANAASYSYTVTVMRAHRSGGYCVLSHRDILHTRISVISTFLTDLVLLILMFTGILRWRKTHAGSSIWLLLYTQGLAWVAVFTLVEIPPMIFTLLNLNDVMDLMFMASSAILTTVGASRMYLWLVNSAAFTSPPVGAVDEEEKLAGSQILHLGPPDPSFFSEVPRGGSGLYQVP